MRILIVNGHLHIGGVEKSLVNLLKAFDYSQHQVDLLLVEDLGEYRGEIPSQVRVLYYDMKPTYGSVRSVLAGAVSDKNYKLAWRKTVITAGNKIGKRCLSGLDLPTELRQIYDCAIAYRVGMPLDLVSYAIKAKRKCVWWHHGEFDYSAEQTYKWKKCFDRLDSIVCVSESSRKMLADHYPALKDKMQVFPNLIFPDEIDRLAEAFQPFAMKSDQRIIVSVGRFSPEKHMIDTVEAMRALRKRGHNDLIWYLVGDGVERKPIEQKIAEYGLKDCIFLVGNQANPYPYIKNADLFVHPSWVESQGIAVLEAMALGMPCVVVHSSGTDEFVIDGDNAFCAEKSVVSLANAIEAALNEDWRQKAERQRLTVEQYTANSLIPILFKMLEN